MLRLHKRLDLGLIVILLIAGILRLSFPGLYQLGKDETNLLYWSQRIANHSEIIFNSNNRAGDWIIAGIPVTRHSAFTNYIAAIPYLLVNHPYGPRLLIALMGTVTVGVLYWTVKRYVNVTSAIFAGILVAFSLSNIDWVRVVDNRTLAPLFITLWLYTGLRGYYETNQPSKVGHWLCLSAAIQSHPSNVLLGILSLFLLVFNWVTYQSQRRQLIKLTLIGWVLIGISLIPWVLGLLFKSQFNPYLFDYPVMGQINEVVNSPILRPYRLFNRFSRLIHESLDS